MRTKTILLAAAVFAAGLGVSLAQSPVYSVNAVGYVTKTLTNGFNLISIPLNGTNNDLNTTIPVAPDGTLILRWVGGSQSFDPAPNQYYDGFGWFPTATINPGEGLFVSIPPGTLTTNLTFVGEVPQGNLTNHIDSGAYSLLAQIVPQAISLGDPSVTFPALDGDIVLFWNPVTQSYKDPTQFYDGFGWFPVDPIPAVGEGFFYNNAPGHPGRDWTRTFSVN
jgi:hypothetical protein